MAKFIHDHGRLRLTGDRSVSPKRKKKIFEPYLW